MEESYVSDPALPLSLSISFPSNVSLGDAAIWLFIAAWALRCILWNLVLVLWFLYHSFAFSVCLICFPWATVASVNPVSLYPMYFHVFFSPQSFSTFLLGFCSFYSIFFLTFLCFLLAQGAPSHSETVDWAQASASLCYNPIHPGSRHWPQRHCWRRKGKMQTIPEEVQPWSSALG